MYEILFSLTFFVLFGRGIFSVKFIKPCQKRKKKDDVGTQSISGVEERNSVYLLYVYVTIPLSVIFCVGFLSSHGRK